MSNLHYIFDQADRESKLQISVENYQAIKNECESMEHQIHDLKNFIKKDGVSVVIISHHGAGFWDEVRIKSEREDLSDICERLEKDFQEKVDSFLQRYKKEIKNSWRLS